MSRWIDADAFERAVMFSDDEDLQDVIYRLRDYPSIDLVRCGECKYEPICTHSVQHTTHEPTSVTIGYKSVDFCSYGERKESE